MAKEIVVVEGKDDAAAVKRACQVEVLITNGMGITKETLQLIKTAQERCGVIILTDPDYPGEKIRRIINEAVPGCRNAYISQQDIGKIGVEYASPEEIREALSKAHLSQKGSPGVFSLDDLYRYRLIGHKQAKERRYYIGRVLGLGETNGKQFLNRLNAYCITRQEFEKAILGRQE